jgi:putative hemolysin
MANPAAVYCAEQGYKSDIRTASDGSQAGFCVFPDGTECDEWAFLRGECGQDKSFCAKHQGKLQKGDGGATCTFADGSSCPEYDFFAGTCKPGAK